MPDSMADSGSRAGTPPASPGQVPSETVPVSPADPVAERQKLQALYRDAIKDAPSNVKKVMSTFMSYSKGAGTSIIDPALIIQHNGLVNIVEMDDPDQEVCQPKTVCMPSNAVLHVVSDCSNGVHVLPLRYIHYLLCHLFRHDTHYGYTLLSCSACAVCGLLLGSQA
jgi:hypothetical protein